MLGGYKKSESTITSLWFVWFFLTSFLFLFFFFHSHCFFCSLCMNIEHYTQIWLAPRVWVLLSTYCIDFAGNHFEEDEEDGKPSSLPSKAENPEVGYSLQVLRHSLSIHNSSRGVSILKKNIINQLWRPNASRVTSEYRCTLCQKTFTRRDHLRTHERNLHGQDAGPFTCCICMQLYKNADSLRKHVTKYHFSREVATSTSTATTTTTDVPSW